MCLKVTRGSHSHEPLCLDQRENTLSTWSINIHNSIKWEFIIKLSKNLGIFTNIKYHYLIVSPFCLLSFNYPELYTEEIVQARKLEYIHEWYITSFPERKILKSTIMCCYWAMYAISFRYIENNTQIYCSLFSQEIRNRHFTKALPY